MKLALFLPTVVLIIALFIPGNGFTEEQMAIKAGQELFNQRGCPLCHTIKGEGGDVGPNLTQVGNHRTRGWLNPWLSNPLAIKPGTLMPKPPVNDQERRNLISFLLSNKKEIDRKRILALPLTKAGAELVKAYDCFACHNIKGKGGRVGPELTKVGKRRNRSWLTTWLKDPQKVKPGTFMPTFLFVDKETKALAEYLSQLK